MNALWIVAAGMVLLAIAAFVYWRRRQARYMPQLPASLRTDLLYGYYGRDDAQCDDTAGAVNLAVELRWDSLEATIARMRKQPLRTVLTVTSECWADTKTPRPADQAQALLRQTLDMLRSAGVIHHVIGFYILDEPDLWGASDADMTAVCATVRMVAAEYPDLGGTVLACCYANKGHYPGVQALDWVGLDDYPQDGNMLTGSAYRGLRAALRPEQRVFLIPGGCDPFRGSPEAFRRAAHADPQVVAVMPFIWIDYDDPSGKRQRGIRSNGLAPVYQALGRELIGGAP